jgi:dTDP-4-amino-4,6-dideoxygalactose transaminase
VDVERGSHFAFPVLLADRAHRDRFREHLKDAGVQTTWYPALHTFTDYRPFAPEGGLRTAGEAADRHCALPLSSSMTLEEIDLVVEVVTGFLS